MLALLAEGLTAAAIARRLNISPHTVPKHQERLYRKLGTRDRLTTVLVAQDLDLVMAPSSEPGCPGGQQRGRAAPNALDDRVR